MARSSESLQNSVISISTRAARLLPFDNDGEAKFCGISLCTGESSVASFCTRASGPSQLILLRAVPEVAIPPIKEIKID